MHKFLNGLLLLQLCLFKKMIMQARSKNVVNLYKKLLYYYYCVYLDAAMSKESA